MEEQNLVEFFDRIKEVNKVYSELEWKDFLENNKKHIRYTPWQGGFSKNSLSFIDKANIESSFNLPSADLFFKHIENTDSRICTLHSSALLPLLLFYRISPSNKLNVRINNKLISFDDVRFEVPNKVFHSSFPSKIDIALISHSQQTVLYLESKFTEYLTGSSSDKVADAYTDTFRELGIELVNQKIGGTLGGYPIIYGDGIKQFIAHFIGVCKGGTPKNEVEIYIEKGYKICLGEIVYMFNSNEAIKRYNSYADLYSKLVSILTKKLASSEKTGEGTVVEVLAFQEIIRNARDFEILPQLQTYQELLKENSSFKQKIAPSIIKFYKL